jgi:hypothetical protein
MADPSPAYDWYKHLTTVDGVAIVAVGAFLEFGGTNITNVLVSGLAFVAIILFFISIGMAIGGMYLAMFKPSVSWPFVAFPTFLAGLIAFFIALLIHFVPKVLA